MPTAQHHIDKLTGNIQEAVTTAVAGGAITYSWWREYVHSFSPTATDFLPILGCFWLFIKIIHLLAHWKSKPQLD